MQIRIIHKSAAVKKRLDELAKVASQKSGQPVETMIRQGNVYEEINKVADVLNPLFVMIGITSKLAVGKINNFLDTNIKKQEALISR